MLGIGRREKTLGTAWLHCLCMPFSNSQEEEKCDVIPDSHICQVEIGCHDLSFSQSDLR